MAAASPASQTSCAMTRLRPSRASDAAVTPAMRHVRTHVLNTWVVGQVTVATKCHTRYSPAIATMRLRDVSRNNSSVESANASSVLNVSC